MQISDLTANPRLVVEQIRNQALASLRPGQTVQARVLDVPQAGRLKLAIGTLELQVKTPLSLKAGDTLLLKVVKAPDPLELMLLRPAATGDAKAKALRTALPRQQALAPLLNQLQKLIPGGERTPPPAPSTTTVPGSQAQPPVTHQTSTPVPAGTQPAPAATSTSLPRPPPSLPAAQRQAIDQLLALVTTGSRPISTESLRQAFEQSGLFLESHLARQQAPVLDLKAALLKLLFQLRGPEPETPARPGQLAPGTDGKAAVDSLPVPRPLAELIPATEGGLARILINQMASLLPTPETTQQAWQFELPLRHHQGIDNFQIRFEKQAPTAGRGGEPGWSVRLDFDLQGLGPISVRLTLRGEEISSQFTVARADSAQRIGRAMPQFIEALGRAGLQVGRMSIAQGEASDDSAAAAAGHSLLDEKA